MSEFAAALAADLHLDPLGCGAWSRRPILGDCWFALQQIGDWCQEHQVPHLLLAGDLHDRPDTDPYSVDRFLDFMHHLQKGGTRTVYILGDHDQRGGSAWPHLYRSALHLDGKGMRLRNGARVWGFDYRRPGALPDALRAVPAQTDVLLCHQRWLELMGRHRPSDFSIAELPVPVPHLWTGDYHANLGAYYNYAGGGRVRVLSPGASHMRDIADHPERFFWAVTDALEAVKVPLRARRRYDVDLTHLRTEADIGYGLLGPGLGVDVDALARPQEGVPDEIAVNLIRLRYREDRPEVYARFERALAGRAHLFAETVSVVVGDIAVTDEQVHLDDTVLDVLRSVVEPGPARDGLERLLQSSDPSRELDAMEREFLQGPAPGLRAEPATTSAP